MSVVGVPDVSGAFNTARPSGGIVVGTDVPVQTHVARLASQLHVEAGRVAKMLNRASSGRPLLLKMSPPGGQLAAVQQAPGTALELQAN
jgi:hypothetical protein